MNTNRNKNLLWMHYSFKRAKLNPAQTYTHSSNSLPAIKMSEAKPSCCRNIKTTLSSIFKTWAEGMERVYEHLKQTLWCICTEIISCECDTLILENFSWGPAELAVREYNPQTGECCWTREEQRWLRNDSSTLSTAVSLPCCREQRGRAVEIREVNCVGIYSISCQILPGW